MSTCPASVVIDFDSITCRLPDGHRGPHEQIGEGANIVWLARPIPTADPTADPYRPDEPRDALAQAIWDATRHDAPGDFMPTVMTDLGSCLRAADHIIAALPGLGWTITRDEETP